MSIAAPFRDPRNRADLPQFSADSRWRRNLATLSAVHKKVQGGLCVEVARWRRRHARYYD